MTRREAIAAAAAIGAALALPLRAQRTSTATWRERRDLFPEGVASGDPRHDSVILWVRRPPSGSVAFTRLRVEIAADKEFHNVVSTRHVPISAASDWTCRVLAAGLAPNRVYWYRFTDDDGNGSRIGRTITAPAPTDDRPVRFAFVSCQNVQQGACNAYRRMIWEDERARPGEQLGFVLHLGDFVYEIVWYPEERPQGYYARRIRELVRYAPGETHADFHVPTTVDDYRALYRAYLADPDLQDARARFPFVCMPDNHEFSWKGWQSQESFGAVVPAQTRKVAANQAWFEYQPARVARPGPTKDDHFVAPRVADAPISRFDDHGLGDEPGNLAAIGSLTYYRSMRWGKNVDLILTDNRSYRAQPLTDRPEAVALRPKDFPAVVAEDVIETLDAGRAARNGKPPATIPFNGADVPNPRLSSPPQSMLGARQKAWFLDRLRSATAAWKVWGNSVGMLDWRTDFQNLPAEIGRQWPTTGYALFGDDDWSAYRHERREIFEFVRANRIGGLATICGDRHSFIAGVLSPTLPPRDFQPIGVEFVTGSISAPGLAEAMEYGVPRDHPLRPIYVNDVAGAPPRPAINLSIMHGVRSSLELARTGDLKQAVGKSNAELAPHLSFVDVGGHGYSVVRATPAALEVEFVCIPRPIERSTTDDGGPIAYRVTHRVARWRPGDTPTVSRTSATGELPLVP
jgi:alkaline phosphatase D